MTCFDRFVVEALFSPQVIPLMRMFAFGDTNGHRLRQVQCPAEYAGCKYEDAFLDLLKEKAILVGLLRMPERGSSFVEGESGCEDNKLPDTTLPYVMTNPEPG